MAGKPQEPLSQFIDASMNNLDINTIWFRDNTFLRSAKSLAPSALWKTISSGTTPGIGEFSLDDANGGFVFNPTSKNNINMLNWGLSLSPGDTLTFTKTTDNNQYSIWEVETLFTQIGSLDAYHGTIKYKTGPNAIIGNGETYKISRNGPIGPTGADSTVPGPKGTTGADSTVPGPPGADSTVPGPKGPTGADSTVPGPPGADSTVPGPKGTTGADGVDGSGGIIDMGASFSFTPSTMKSDLTKPSQQVNSYCGQVEKWNAGETISNGDVVIRSLDDKLELMEWNAITSKSVPNSYDIIGISLGNAVVGNPVSIMQRGYCTAKFISQVLSPPPDIKRLVAGDEGSLFVLTGESYFFQDSGGITGDYKSSEEYYSTFDAGSGQSWSLKFVTEPENASTFFEFEHTDGAMYDRLGVQHSEDGKNWVNLSVPWMQSSANTIAPWSDSYGGATYSAVDSKNGWILPKDVLRAKELGFTDDTVVVTNQYVRFAFISDFGTTKPGWNIEMISSSYIGEISTNDVLYVDVNSPDNVSRKGSVIVGRVAHTDIKNNSVFMRVTQ